MAHDRAIGQNMLIAVHDLVLTPVLHDPTVKPEAFWKALADFVPEFMPGRFNIEIHDDGRVVASYHPPK